MGFTLALELCCRVNEDGHANRVVCICFYGRYTALGIGSRDTEQYFKLGRGESRLSVILTLRP